MTVTQLPITGIALQITERKQTTPLTLAEVDIPSLGDHEMLLKNVVAGQAAGDCKMVDLDIMIPTLPFTNGWDCAGEILAIGSKVTRFQVGDRVTSKAPAVSPSTGAYQQYPIIYDHFTAKIPTTLSFEQAATFSLSFATVLPGLSSLGFFPPTPPAASSSSPNDWILINGGASSIGSMAIQLIKLLSPRTKVIATASERNWELVKKMGADEVVGYAGEEMAVRRVKEVTKDGLKMVHDAIASPSTISLGVHSLGSQGGTAILVPNGSPLQENTHGREDVTFVPRGAGNHQSTPELAASFEWLQQLLLDDKLVPHPFEIIPGGLSGVDEGWNRQREGKISAVKLLYRVEETPGIAA